MKFKNFSRAQFSKLRNGINGVGQLRYDTIYRQNFVSIGYLVQKLLGGNQNFTQTHTHRDTHTDTHTHRGPFYKSCFSTENAETRLKKVGVACQSANWTEEQGTIDRNENKKEYKMSHKLGPCSTGILIPSLLYGERKIFASTIQYS